MLVVRLAKLKMEALAIDFDKLEVETWNGEDQSMEGTFGKVSRTILNPVAGRSPMISPPWTILHSWHMLPITELI